MSVLLLERRIKSDSSLTHYKILNNVSYEVLIHCHIKNLMSNLNYYLTLLTGSFSTYPGVAFRISSNYTSPAFSKYVITLCIKKQRTFKVTVICFVVKSQQIIFFFKNPNDLYHDTTRFLINKNHFLFILCV